MPGSEGNMQYRERAVRRKVNRPIRRPSAYSGGEQDGFYDIDNLA
jgi:hypothetical protein